MYEQIAANKRNTFILITAMVALLMGLGYVIGLFFGSEIFGLIMAAVIAIVMAIVSYSSGDSIILNISQAREIKKADDPQLFNVVEELAIAAGVPMPRVFLIDDPAPNAFATGRDPQHATVAITTGLREKLKRDELQGVMAHELSHIQNRDILYMMMLGVMVGAIVILAHVFSRSLWYRSVWGGSGRRSGKGAGQAQIIFVAVGLLLAILAPLFATIIQLAASRQREYLADASAAKLTRYPEGLASALEKIAKDKEQLKVANKATQHLYIVNPFTKARKQLSMIWDTHPSIEERIQRLRALK